MISALKGRRAGWFVGGGLLAWVLGHSASVGLDVSPSQLDTFHHEWTRQQLVGAMVVATDESIRVTVQQGQSVAWRSSVTSHGPSDAELSVEAKVSEPLMMNAVPVAITTESARSPSYVHLHANTYGSYGWKFYGDRNYNDGRGDVATRSPVLADDGWHAYVMRVEDRAVSSWIDGHLVHSEPWPFKETTTWWWTIACIGDRGGGTLWIRNVRLDWKKQLAKERGHN